MIHGTGKFYRSFYIPKKNSKDTRKITVPYPSLRQVQDWILQEILSKRVEDICHCAHGYIKNKSILTNVEGHLNKAVFLKIDLKNFFPNININQVIKLFLKMGYSSNISYYLASLCTLNNQLPQGACTSPMISNLIAKKMDTRLDNLCKKYYIHYSRYADDMAFSGDSISKNFQDLVYNIIKECGFQINLEKSYLSTNKNKRILTGLSIINEKPQLPRKTKRDIIKEVYYINTYGYFSHINKKKINNPFYLESLYGRLIFWRLVEPESIDAKNGITIIKNIINSLRN